LEKEKGPYPDKAENSNIKSKKIKQYTDLNLDFSMLEAEILLPNKEENQDRALRNGETQKLYL